MLPGTGVHTRQLRSAGPTNAHKLQLGSQQPHLALKPSGRLGFAGTTSRVPQPSVTAAAASGGRGRSQGPSGPDPEDSIPSSKGSSSMGSEGSVRQFVLDMGADVLIGANPVLSKEERLRLDERDAAEVFASPNTGTHHTDDHYRALLTGLYAQLLPKGSSVLDLCSSWASHLPEGLGLQVTGHGVNEEELAANRQLSQRLVQDLNRRPQLPGVASASQHAVVCSNGLQYLNRPEWVLAEVSRMLRPGGVVVIAFSVHCWEALATSAWLQRSHGQRMALVGRLLDAAGFTQIQYVCSESQPGGAVDGSSAGQHGSEAGPGAGPAGASKAPAGVGFYRAVPSWLLSQGTEGVPGAGAGKGPANQAGPDPLFAVVARKPAPGSQQRNSPGPSQAAAGSKASSSYASSRQPAPGEAEEGAEAGAGVEAEAQAAQKRDQQRDSQEQGFTYELGGQGERTPEQVAESMVGPALREIEMFSSGGMQLLPPKSAQQGLGQSGLLQPQPLPSAQLQPLRGPQGSGQGRGTGTEQDVVVSKETLERWRAAYAEMSNDAMALGIPSSAIPPLPPDAGPAQVKAARDHLQDMVASFLSAGL